MDINKLKERLWEESKPAEDINVDWFCIPTLDAIRIIESEIRKTQNDTKEKLSRGNDK